MLTVVLAIAIGAGECFVMMPLDGVMTVVGGNECSRRTLPASTFKIPHALAALQAGVITEQVRVCQPRPIVDTRARHHRRRRFRAPHAEPKPEQVATRQLQ
jgi:beta-lactamase class D